MRNGIADLKSVDRRRKGMEKTLMVFVGIAIFFVCIMFISFGYAWFNNMRLIKYVKPIPYIKIVFFKGFFKYMYDNDANDPYLLKLKQNFRKGTKYSLICLTVILIDVIIIALLIKLFGNLN